MHDLRLLLIPPVIFATIAIITKLIEWLPLNDKWWVIPLGVTYAVTFIGGAAILIADIIDKVIH